MDNWFTPQWNSLTGELSRLPHALLLHGPRGIGKQAFATRFASLLLCEARRGNQPCGRCDPCRWFADGNHPDYRLVQPEAMAQDEEEAGGDEQTASGSRKAKPSVEIKVDQIRALAEFLHVGSHRGARRVALVCPAEAMNLNAANALLKALEEPPGSAMFILVSHDPARLLPTVRSRCIRVALPLPATAEAAAWLKSEGVAEPLRWLRFAGGAPILALELAKGEGAGERARMVEALSSGDTGGLSVNTRESLQLLAEVMQKQVYDRVFAKLAGRAKYGPEPDKGAYWTEQWLGFARDLGQARAMARRPLNPKLFGAELLARFSELSKY